MYMFSQIWELLVIQINKKIKLVMGLKKKKKNLLKLI